MCGTPWRSAPLISNSVWHTANPVPHIRGLRSGASDPLDEADGTLSGPGLGGHNHERDRSSGLGDACMMVNAQSGPVMRQNQRLFSVGTIAEMSDAELQVRFAGTRRNTESAFATAADATLPPPSSRLSFASRPGKYHADGSPARARRASAPSRVVVRVTRVVLLTLAVSGLRGGADRAPAGICARFTGRRAGVRPPWACGGRSTRRETRRARSPRRPAAAAGAVARWVRGGFMTVVKPSIASFTRPMGGSWRRPSNSAVEVGTRRAVGSYDAWAGKPLSVGGLSRPMERSRRIHSRANRHPGRS